MTRSGPRCGCQIALQQTTQGLLEYFVASGNRVAGRQLHDLTAPAVEANRDLPIRDQMQLTVKTISIKSPERGNARIIPAFRPCAVHPTTARPALYFDTAESFAGVKP
jgi:hypothetical protein